MTGCAGSASAVAILTKKQNHHTAGEKKRAHASALGMQPEKGPAPQVAPTLKAQRPCERLQRQLQERAPVLREPRLGVVVVLGTIL